MNQDVMNLEPKMLWSNFEALNAVPRPSKKEERVIAFLLDFGKQHGIETIQDKIGNIIMRKPATAGYENRKTVVLQSHIDMVHQKNADTDFDFDSEGIKSFIDGDWVKAKGTTLGADNGIGVAAMMSVLEDNTLEHGPIECLFTVDEETGMTGAFGLEGGLLQAEILLNLDTEDEGELTIGCAGGVDTTATKSYVQEQLPVGYKTYKISLKGLKGGHSGGEIHLGRANANKLMNRILWFTHGSYGLRIHEIDGGSLRNAIPRESFAVVAVLANKATAFEAHVKEQEGIFQAEYAKADGGIQVVLEEVTTNGPVMELEFQKQFINAIQACPNGVIRMSNDIEGLVETSTNLARVSARNGELEVLTLQRSSVDSGKDDVARSVGAPFRLLDCKVTHSGSYPGWAPNPASPVLKEMETLFKAQFGYDPTVNAVHAGLECGIIGEAYPGMDMVSFGPTIKNPHSPDEMVEIATVTRFWDYLLEILKNIPAKG
ncbi:aminoacyl-histidine dipeptidase [Persicobacter diffluens]|uniref:Cytosol non-specific dipeptidase n=1 Tax=Persicobacter diffluens TaxID=981 RepID=A0AAN4VY57_9BACT|nr:aminoacyl-histidine dipeptidase [Persicobacter diffluens]